MSDLTTRLSPSLILPSPILAASGSFGYGEESADLADCRTLGALITPTLTHSPRTGNPMPRTVETAAGLLHSLGLPNPGLQAFLAHRMPALRALPCPVIVSILGESDSEWRQLAAELTQASGILALELNLTPLILLDAARTRQNLPTETALLQEISQTVSVVRSATELPLIAKLPPLGIDPARAAQAAADAGADVLAVGQSLPGIAVRLSVRRFRLPGVVGGLSGPCIKPLALYQVWRVRQSVTLPVIASGGIMNAEDALEFLVAGASAVAVGVANLIHPTAIAKITREMNAYLDAHSLTLSELHSA